MMKILVLMFLSVLYGVPYDGLTLITDIGQAGQGGGSEQYETQLIDNQLNVINSWFYDTGPASIAYLTPDSILFLPCNVNQNQGAGPNGGRFKKIDWDGNVIWDYEMPKQEKKAACRSRGITWVEIGSIESPIFFATWASTAGLILAKVPTAPEIAQVAISFRATSSRSRLRLNSA